jgi:hypothetical protein
MLQTANARVQASSETRSGKGDVTKPAKKQLGRRPLGGVIFVLFTFALWFVFGTLAEVVITCVPGGARCLLADGWWVWRTEPATDTINKREAFVMIMTLLIAAWAAMRVFFPPEDFETSDGVN